VPALWPWEILNVIAVTVRRGRITADRAEEFLKQLAALNFRIHAPPTIADFPRLQTLAKGHGLTAYDVAYLDLAIRLSLPVATVDDDLHKAVVAEGLEALG